MKLELRGILKIIHFNFARNFTCNFMALSLALVLVGTSACSNQRTQEAIAVDQAETYLDKSDFTGAIGFISQQLNQFEDDLPLEALLANAYMGRAGIELLPLVVKLMGVQETTPLNLYNEPVCSSDALTDLSKISSICLFYRLFRQLPEVDNPDLLQAKAIYRKYFPDPATATNQVNFAAGIVEAFSVITRVRALLDAHLVDQMHTGLKVDPTLFPYDKTIHQLKQSIDELNWSLSRFRNSYQLLEDLVVKSLNGSMTFTFGSRSLLISDSITYPMILRFISSVLIDQSVVIDFQLSDIVTNWLNESGAGITSLVQAIQKPADRLNQSLAPFQFQLNLADYFAQLLNSLADLSEQNVKISFFELLWKNPPLIVNHFLFAAGASWDAESGDPIRNYFTQYKPNWILFKQIVNDWDHFFEQSLTSDIETQLFNQIAQDASSQSSLLATSSPQLSNLQTLTQWTGNAGQFLGNEVILLTTPSTITASTASATLTATNADASLKLLLPPQIANALKLRDETNLWMSQNFYPVSDWVSTQ